MNRWKKRLGIVAVVIASLVVGAVITYAVTRTNSSIPASVRSDLSFSPLVPTGDTVKVSGYKLSAAEDGTQTLGYLVTADRVRVVVTQHQQPKQFIDVPEYKERFLSSVVNQTATVQTANGVIYLGQTKDDNKQIGVMLEKGLLIFFNPNRTLDETSWRLIGDSLVIEQVRR